MIVVGPRIRQLRKRAGLTQAQLGGRIGRTQNCVATWEAGRNPSLADLEQIAKACGVDLIEVFADVDGDSDDDPDLAPRVRLLRKIADALDIPADALAGIVSE